MLVAVGFLMLLVLAVLVVKGKFLPGMVLGILPIITALAIGTGLSNTMRFVAIGMMDVLPVVALFLFSITYFGIMMDVGLFDRIVKALVGKVGNSIFSVLCITALIAIVSHLDGSGVSTLLITVPAMLPVFSAMNIRRVLLLLSLALPISVMNLLPWAGPVGRVASVLGVDPGTIWQSVIPVQIIGLVMIFVVLYFAAKIETKRGELTSHADLQSQAWSMTDEEVALKRPKMWWVNLILTLILLATLVAGIPSFIVFMVGCILALGINFKTMKEQHDRLRAHAKNVIPIAFTIVCAGAFLGVLNETGMVGAMANALLNIFPAALGQTMHVIAAIIIQPLAFVLDADPIIFGVFPVLLSAAGQYGITAISMASVFLVSYVIATTLCMTSPTVYFALGMVGIEYKDAFKYLYRYILVFGTLMIVITAFIVR